MIRNKVFHQKKMIGKKLTKKNVTVVFNVLYTKKEKMYHAYVSKNNPSSEKQVILLMISNQKKWHYLPAENYQHY